MDCSNHDDSDSDSHIMAAIKHKAKNTSASRRHPLGDITGKQKTNAPTSTTPKTPRTPAATTTQAESGTSRSASADSQRYALARPASWRSEIIERLKRVEQKQDVILSMLAKRNDDEEARPQKSTKVEVPNSIRVSVKDGYTNGQQEGKQWITEKLAEDGKIVFLRFDSAENLDMTTSIKTTVKGLYPAVNDIVLKDISEAECVESLQDIKNGVDPL